MYLCIPGLIYIFGLLREFFMLFFRDFIPSSPFRYFVMYLFLYQSL